LSDAIRISFFLKQLGDSQFQRGRGGKKENFKGKGEKKKSLILITYLNKLLKLTLQNPKF
jgi:hypothetical protein